MSKVRRGLVLALVTALLSVGLAPAVALAAPAPAPTSPLPRGTITGIISEASGASLAGTVLLVSLFSIDPSGAAYPTPQTTNFLVADPSGPPTRTFSLVAPVAGYYAIQVRPLNAGTPTPYRISWYGQHGLPSQIGDPGLIFMNEAMTPLAGKDISISRGVVVRGTVRGSNGQPLTDVTVHPAQWFAGAVSDIPSTSDALTNSAGAFSITVPTYTALTLSVPSRTGYDPWVLGGDRTTPTAGNTIVLGATDLTIPDITLTPTWAGMTGPSIVSDEVCLQHAIGGDAVIGPLSLTVSSMGYVVRSDATVDPGVSPLAGGFPALVPYWSNQPRTLTWGTSGTTLCATWRNAIYGDAYQLIATADAGGQLDVTYNYAAIGPNTSRFTAVAGWDDGVTNLLPIPYEDGTGGLSTRSVDSTVPGRVHAVIDGFQSSKVVNQAPPSITRDDSSGTTTLTALAGQWTVQGAPVGVITYAYQWMRDGVAVAGATGATFQPDRRWATSYTVAVTARQFGSGGAKAESAAVSVEALGVVTPATAPTVAGDPMAGGMLTADPGTWLTPGTTTSFAWTVGGQDRGTAPTLALTAADIGQDVALTVTARAPGTQPGTSYLRVGTVRAADAPTSTIAVAVRDAQGAVVTGATIVACDVATGVCIPADAQQIVRGAVPGSSYHVAVTPTASSRLHAESATLTAAAGANPLTVTLRPRAALPSGIAFDANAGDHDGGTAVYWGSSTTFRIVGCTRVTDLAFTVAYTDGTASSTGTLVESTSRPGIYEATFPDVVDHRGDAHVTTSVPTACGGAGVGFDVWVEPQAQVVDQYGRGVAHAQVVLTRADTAAGPYTFIPGGDPALLPDPNPYTADDRGWFQFSPPAGWYVATATATGCSSGATTPMPVDPQNLNVTIRLVCDAAAPSTATPLTVTVQTPAVQTPAVQTPAPQSLPAPTASSPTFRTASFITRAATAAAPSATIVPAAATVPTAASAVGVGTTLVATGGTSTGITVIRWLRGGTVVGTGRTYVVQAADIGQQLRAEAVSTRADLLQDPGRGVPVTFASIRTTSAPFAITAPSTGGSGTGGTGTGTGGGTSSGGAGTPPATGGGTGTTTGGTTTGGTATDGGATTGTTPSGSTATPRGALPRTGSDPLDAVVLAAVLVLLGGAIVLRTRRRRLALPWRRRR